MAHFGKQEAQHSAEHHRANQFLQDKLGVQVDMTQEAYTEMLKGFEGNDKEQFRMALVLTGEHLLGEFGHLILEQKLIEDVAEPLKSLFTWHAYEEFEHNCIAVDAYYHIYGNNLQSYLVRLKAFWTFAYTFAPIQKAMPAACNKPWGNPLA